MRKVFEIKVTSSASFYSYLALSGIDFKTKEKPDVIAELPKNYYLDDDPSQEIQVKWRSHAYLLFSNWLNYYVYQETPYDLSDLHERKK